MAKSKKTKNSSKIEEQISSSANVKSTIKLIIAIAVILLIFYLLTVLILNKKSTNITSNASIQYSKILAGETFNMNENDYLVFFYDTTSDDSSSYAETVSNYKEKDKHLTIYTVDLNEGLNKKYINEDENPNATKASELRINNATLIHITNGKIVDYITSSFDEYLENTIN